MSNSLKSYLDWLDVLNGLSRLINPARGLFRLAPEVASPVSSVLCCKVDCFQECYPSNKFLIACTLLLLSRQAIAAIFFSLLLAWGGLLII